MDEIVFVSSPNQHYATGPECHTPDHTPTGPKPRPRKNKNQQHQARTRTCMMSGVRKPASSTFSTAVSSRSAACFLLLLDFSFCGVFKGLVFVLFVLVFCGWGCFFNLVWLVWVRLSVGLISVESRVCRDGGGHWPIQSKTRPALYNIIHPSTSIHPSNHIALSHTSPWAVRGRSEASWRPTKSWPAGSPCPVFMVFIFVCLWG